MFSLFQFLFYSIVLSEVAFHLILRRTNNIWVHFETESTTYLFSIYLERHSALAPNRKYPIADTWKLIILKPSQFFSLLWFLFYSTVLSEVAFRLILRRTNNIWVHLETESTTYLFSIYLEWHSALAPSRRYPITDTWKLIILTPCQIFSLFRFLFHSTVLSEVAFRLILRRTNNIWVHLETESTTYLFSVHNLLVLNLFGAAFRLSSKQKVSNCRHLKIDSIETFSIFFTIQILILLYCPLWGGIPPYPQKDK